MSIFTPTSAGTAEITAVISHPALGDENLTSSVLVLKTPAPHQASLVELVLTQAPFVHVPYVAIAAVAAVAVLLVFFVRRRGGGKVEEVVGEGFEGTSTT